jgi:GNAT superfamily N-acetyltransferase
VFVIRKISDHVLQVNRDAVRQVQGILRAQFRGVPEPIIEKISEQLQNPLKFQYQTILFVGEDQKKNVRGFAILLNFPDLLFCYLDFMSAAPQRTGGGIGGALYERLREEALLLGSSGLFFECLPDDPRLCADPAVLKQNAARLKFYERYGARPFANTEDETPITPGSDCPPYLVFDDLGQSRKLPRDEAQRVVRAILERKYGKLCPKEYVERVVGSFRDDPAVLREPKYTKTESSPEVRHIRSLEFTVALVVNDKHMIHHVHERGYVETPVRVDAILKEIGRTDLFDTVEVRHFSEKHILSVHDHRFVEYFKKMCAELSPGESVYPYVFPIRNAPVPRGILWCGRGITASTPSLR